MLKIIIAAISCLSVFHRKQKLAVFLTVRKMNMIRNTDDRLSTEFPTSS